jgi:hypothetical protein
MAGDGVPGAFCTIDKGKGVVKGKILLPVAMSNA